MGSRVLLVGLVGVLGVCVGWFYGVLHKVTHQRAHTDRTQKLTRSTYIKHTNRRLFCSCVGLLFE